MDGEALSYVDVEAVLDETLGLYSAVQVVEMTGITYRQLDYWVRVGLIEPSRCARGSGTRRMFDDRDLPDVRLAALLMSIRHDTIWAGNVIARVRRIGGEWAGHTLVIFADGRICLDGVVDGIAVVVNLGALVAPPLVAA